MKNKIKILYVFTALSYGGVEQSLYSYISRLDNHKYDIDIITQGQIVKEIEEKFKALNINVFKFPSKKQNIFKFYISLNNLMKYRKYDIIHCNMTSKSFYYLALAKIHKIKLRIAHSHGYIMFGKRNYIKKCVYTIYNKLTTYYSNCYLASSKEAGDFLFKKKKYTILPNGIDCEEFKYNVEKRRQIRKKYNIKDDEIWIGHIGRFVPVKNHKFIVELMNRIVKKNDKYKFLLIGEGVLKKQIIQMINNNNLAKNVVLIDSTKHPEDYYSALDLFVFPSLHEGFGITVIEANCSGLRCICSSNVPKETNILSENYYIDLDNIERWVQTINEIKINNSRSNFSEKMKKTKYNINKCVGLLDAIYSNSLGKNTVKGENK